MPTMSLMVRCSQSDSQTELLYYYYYFNPSCSDSQCRQFAVCSSAREAAERGGPIGVSLVPPLTANIAARLLSKYQESEGRILAAMDNGISGNNCAALHPCSKPMKAIWTSLLDQLIVYLGLK